MFLSDQLMNFVSKYILEVRTPKLFILVICLCIKINEQ